MGHPSEHLIFKVATSVKDRAVHFLILTIITTVIIIFNDNNNTLPPRI